MIPKKRMILFGGTFNPIHVGHVAVAGQAGQIIGAEKVIFVPTKCSPLKNLPPKISDEHRLEMIRLAIFENEKFELSECEIKKTRPSYTIETVRDFQLRCGEDIAIYWLIGADSVNELPLWYKITELIDECELSVMYRAGYPKPSFEKFMKQWGEKRVEKMKNNVIETSPIDVSSTEIRTRLAKGGNTADILDEKVANYIREHKLYRL